MYEEVLRQIPKNPGLNFIDLGCGYGSLLFFLSRIRPDINFVGVEIAPIPALVAKLRACILRAPVKILWSSFWPVSLSQQDIVYAFLAPSPMPAVWDKARKEMKKGSMLLINSFPLPVRELKKVEVADERNCVLYTYVINGQ
jgi:SAM-dependent methyltransferase